MPTWTKHTLQQDSTKTKMLYQDRPTKQRYTQIIKSLEKYERKLNSCEIIDKMRWRKTTWKNKIESKNIINHFSLLYKEEEKI